MKKLMIAAAIVCAAAFAQAAALDWSATAVIDPWATEEKGSNVGANGWLGYCILAADLSTVTTDLKNGDTTSLISNHVGPIKNANAAGKFSAGTAEGNVAAGDQNFYLIVLNSNDADKADYFFVSAVQPQTVDASLDTTVPFPSQLNASKPTSAWTAMSVPEPTSGILLLLGMAGLALRRRRA